MKSTLLPQFILIALLTVLTVQQTIVYADDRDILIQAQQALTDSKYQQARQLFKQLNSVEAYFGEGTACYRLKDYDCAQQAFASAAWLASDKNIRAKAVFNLANSHFFSGDYDQAVVLYRDAEILGIDADIISINLEFASSMQASVQRHIEYIQHSIQKARWKAAASGESPPSLADFVSDNEDLLINELNRNPQIFNAGISAQAFQQALMLQLGLNKESGQQAAGRWVETDRLIPQSTAKLNNRIFEMQLDIRVPLQQPQIVEGKRKW